MLENPRVFAILGLVGVALFTGAVVCMFRHPSLTCLLGGLVGVLAMAPAAAFFLFRFIGQPVDAEGLPLAEHAEDAEDAEPASPFADDLVDAPATPAEHAEAGETEPRATS